MDVEDVPAVANLLWPVVKALESHACVEKPERNFTKESYPHHECWAALAALAPSRGGEK